MAPLLGPPYDPKIDVERFLATQDTQEEAAILSRLKSQNVSHQLIKAMLRSRPAPIQAPVGLQFNLALDHNGKDYPYALYVPDKIPAGGQLPLVIVLHGMGGNGNDTLPAWAERLGRDFIIVCPSYPMGAWWTKTAEELVLKVILDTRRNYPVDSNRVFLAGLSNGAIGAYMIGMNHPDQFAGIVPIAGAITPRYMHFLVNLRNTPLYLIQGAYDPIFPINLSRRVFQILTDMKYPVVYREHEEKGTAHGGHFLPESEVGPLVEWMKSQKRENFPKVVRMTREANHLGRIHWAQISRGNGLAALQIPGPEKEPINIQDGKVATLFAVNLGRNRFELMGKNVKEAEIYLNSDSIDFNSSIVVILQTLEDKNGQLVPTEKRTGFNRKVQPDIGILLREFKKNRDPNILFDAKITVPWEKTTDFAFRL